MLGAKVLPTRTVEYELEIRIDAPASRVWQALTEETNAWWLPDFHVAAPGSTVTLDAAPGGHLIERTPDDGGILWYTVHACVPGKSMTLIGPLSVDCGPATTMLTLKLVENDEHCVLSVSDALFGHVSDDLVRSLQGGWATLLGDGLKAHVEATVC